MKVRCVARGYAYQYNSEDIDGMIQFMNDTCNREGEFSFGSVDNGVLYIQIHSQWGVSVMPPLTEGMWVVVPTPGSYNTMSDLQFTTDYEVFGPSA